MEKGTIVALVISAISLCIGIAGLAVAANLHASLTNGTANITARHAKIDYLDVPGVVNNPAITQIQKNLTTVVVQVQALEQAPCMCSSPSNGTSIISVASGSCSFQLIYANVSGTQVVSQATTFSISDVGSATTGVYVRILKVKPPPGGAVAYPLGTASLGGLQLSGFVPGLGAYAPGSTFATHTTTATFSSMNPSVSLTEITYTNTIPMSGIFGVGGQTNINMQAGFVAAIRGAGLAMPLGQVTRN